MCQQTPIPVMRLSVHLQGGGGPDRDQRLECEFRPQAETTLLGLRSVDEQQPDSRALFAVERVAVDDMLHYADRADPLADL